MKIFVAGGAGFIGSHLVRRLLSIKEIEVTVFDNFSSGTERHLEGVLTDSRISLIRGDIKDLPLLTQSMAGQEVVYHFASNPDIAKAMTQPDIDFWEGTYLTQNILESARVNKVQKIIYASGSGVYGETSYLEISENHGPLLPISTYGASKLAGEALICSYSNMFGIVGRTYRFANVVGPRQTHGVAYDFIRKLRKDPRCLQILGNGNQSKSYIHVDDVLDAIFLSDAHSHQQYDFFNVATDDYVTVREIADLIIEEMGLLNVEFFYTGGDRGWRGDVPVIRFDLNKIHSLGWKARLNSRQAIQSAVKSILSEGEE